ncbi:hypothetical protein Pmani_009884 [Petrolisthes manimaculis]|uniref:Protein pinocchio n=1 Tax=Petrolisthes manimaculis TaxID=1843537 RepID=A0AAE1Q453_9EUCA|nr:hypothetical protein Pmani_009884 [Petrolisthes manimaculis]
MPWLSRSQLSFSCCLDTTQGRCSLVAIGSSLLHSAVSSHYIHSNNNNNNNMSCGVMQTDTYFNSRSWLGRNENSGSVDGIDLMTSPVDYHHHQHTPIEPPMMTLEDLRSQYNSCYTCGVSWSDNHVSLDCRECGGYSLERPCPLCDGKCGNSWRRDVSMSHSVGKAHWEGECELDSLDRPAVPHFLAEDVLVQGLTDLSTSA